MAERDRPHILIRRPATAEAYTRPPRMIEGRALPAPADRRGHGLRLSGQLHEAEAAALARREERPDEAPRAAGIYVTFESFPDIELAFESLDPQRGKLHPELLAVRSVETGEGIREQATVFVPDGKLGYFLKRLEDYAASAGQERPKNRNLVDRIASIGLASLEQLWTDMPDEFPEPQTRTWWELWLRRHDGQERARVERFAEEVGAQLSRLTLGFADRTVVLIEASAEQLATALSVLDDLAELRRPRQPAALLALEPPAEQADWVAQLAERAEAASNDAPAACVLDTGTHAEHPLLEASLSADDCHACDPTWSVRDHDGHGTEMAGLALFGTLDDVILAGGPVRLSHRLESVKILPPPPAANPPQLYGAVTATAASLVEIQRPGRPRVFSLAVTSDWQTPSPEASRQFGQPTSWSAAIDALSAGLEIDVTDTGLLFLNEATLADRRLFLVSAGNVRVLDDDHLARSDVEPIEDPAHAWNALTVGACTDLVDASSAPGFAGWTAVAPRGELSPFSRTAVAFERTWPHKPDVVLEGGNVARSPAGTEFDTPATLQLLTTKAPLEDQRLLTVTNATSAATAQAAHLGASILVDSPELWPETVRALIVHSAEWTQAMQQQFDVANSRARRIALLRRYGMGVPDLQRATRSATDALTLISQNVIHPFDGQGRTREMHLHELPWPTDVLTGLGAVEVRMRVTLSYFVEPNPARRGWARRYSYASHGLRFSVRQPTESTEDFRKRVNLRARAEEERRPSTESDSSEWFFGPDARATGSLHTDIWRGTAADLAERGVIAVFPVSGWWKERKDRDHSERGARYALVVSIEAPGVDVDIWTPVAQQIGIEVVVDT
jgi:Subtilase family